MKITDEFDTLLDDVSNNIKLLIQNLDKQNPQYKLNTQSIAMPNFSTTLTEPVHTIKNIDANLISLFERVRRPQLNCIKTLYNNIQNEYNDYLPKFNLLEPKSDCLKFDDNWHTKFLKDINNFTKFNSLINQEYLPDELDCHKVNTLPISSLDPDLQKVIYTKNTHILTKDKMCPSIRKTLVPIAQSCIEIFESIKTHVQPFIEVIQSIVGYAYEVISLNTAKVYEAMTQCILGRDFNRREKSSDYQIVKKKLLNVGASNKIIQNLYNCYSKVCPFRNNDQAHFTFSYKKSDAEANEEVSCVINFFNALYKLAPYIVKCIANNPTG